MLIGPWWRIPRFLLRETRAFIRNDPGVRVVWIVHLLWCVPVVYWVTVVCGIPIVWYVVAMVIPGNGLLLVRSFAEHRARPDMRQRTAIVEGSWFFGPLFLFNNLHSLHHEEPLLPWYRYNARYRVLRYAADCREWRAAVFDLFRRRATLPVQAARFAAAPHRSRAAAACSLTAALRSQTSSLARCFQLREQARPARNAHHASFDRDDTSLGQRAQAA